MAISEQPHDLGLAVIEYLPELTFDNQGSYHLAKNTERNVVLHAVTHERAAVHYLEHVVVAPVTVRSAGLLVDEANWRFIFDDLRAPAQSHSKPAQVVQGAHTEKQRRAFLSRIPEARPTWRDPVKIPGVFKEAEDVAAGCGDTHCPLKRIHFIWPDS